jgi:hypothetical protein
VLQLRVFGSSPAMAAVADSLQRIPGSRHVIQMGNGELGDALVTADLVDDAVDRALEQVTRLGVPTEEVVLVRLGSIGSSVAQHPLASVVWSDLVSQAAANARPFPRHLVFMAAAGIIAAFGVIYQNVTLVVGAMAISPDTLPITAAATALVLLRAISVTTIPASAYLGVAAGLGKASEAGGALLCSASTSRCCCSRAA